MARTLREHIAFEQFRNPPLFKRGSISQPLDFNTLKEQAMEFLGKLLSLSIQAAPCAPVAIGLCVSMDQAVPVPDREVESFHWWLSLFVTEIEGEIGMVWQHLFYGLPIGSA